MRALGNRSTSSIRTVREVAKLTGVPRSTVQRDLERSRDVLALEIVFAVLPPKVQQRWLRNKLASA